MAEKRMLLFGFWLGDAAAGGTDGESAAVSWFAFYVGRRCYQTFLGFLDRCHYLQLPLA